MYDIETIYSAQNIPDAISALIQNPDSLLICGGSDVLIKIREGKLAGCSLVSIHDVQELKNIFVDEYGTLHIGPACTFNEVTEHPIIQEFVPTLGYAVDQAGGPQLRNVGTIGGNICNGATSADSAPTLFSLNATLTIASTIGTRTEDIADFYKGPGKVNLKHGEILTDICISKCDYEKYGGHYIKYAMRKAMDIATLGCAVHVKLSADKTSVEDLRLAFGVAAPTPIRCKQTEANVRGMDISPALYEKVAIGALSEVSPRTSWRASKEFRQQLVYELSQRALRQAIENAGGNS